MYKCKNCWEEENVILKEWMGAYDGCLALECKSCWESYHLRTWFSIINSMQKENYGDVLFILSWPSKIPLRYVNQFPYAQCTIEDDALFENLEEEKIL